MRGKKNMSMIIDLSPSQKKAFHIGEGVRFLRNGHWWEVERGIKGKMNTYFRCKPVCLVESRFYSEMEILDSLEKENEKVRGTRGTGRIKNRQSHSLTSNVVSINSKKKESEIQKLPHSSKKENLKILLVGSQKKVRETIENFHVSGFAKADDWSPFQKRPNGKDVLTILIQKC